MNEEWQKSSLSVNNGQCVQVRFRKSSASTYNGNILMRNSRDSDGSQLSFTEGEWNAFIGGVKLGEFDLDEDGTLPEMPPLLRSIIT
jgi:Domain of unknown function (DUF397)